MKKILYIALFLILTLLLGTTKVAEAKSVWNWPWREEVKEELKEIKEENKEFRQEIKEQVREQLQDRLKKLTGTPSPAQVREFGQKYPFVNFAGIRWATIQSIGASSIVVKLKDDKTATLNISEKTVILRKFGGKSSLAELKVGDIVMAVGTWTQTDPPVLETKVLRDLSILKRKATFWGKIKSISGNTFVLTTIFRGELTIKTDDNTKLVDRRQETIAFSDLKVGHRVRISGVWDQSLKVVEEVSLIKDWTIAPQKIDD